MTATTALPDSALRSWIAGGLLAILAFGVCWTGAIVYWRAQEGDPGTGELMFYLFILPAVLLAGALVTRKRLGDTAPDTATVHATAAADAPIAVETALPLAIAAAAVRSPYGASVEALAASLAGKAARPTLDAALRDAADFPRTTARCPEADDPAVVDAIAAWFAASGIAVHFDAAAVRALVLATQVATDLAARLEVQPALQLVPVFPAGWMREQRHAAGLWLQHTLVQHGWTVEQLTMAPPDDTDLFDPVPARLLAALATRRGDAAVAALIVACASYLDDAAAASIPVPGEGAAALLLTDPAQAGAVVALLEPVRAARRDTSADSSRGPLPPLLANLAQAALDAAILDAGAVAMIVADTGPRPGRMLELMGYAGAATPQLDNEEDVIAYGQASGNCGAVTAMTALALARHHACERNGPVLWIANDDPFQRCAAVVRPPPAP